MVSNSVRAAAQSSPAQAVAAAQQAAAMIQAFMVGGCSGGGRGVLPGAGILIGRHVTRSARACGHRLAQLR